MKLGGILEIYEKFQGVDPREVPMKIFPAVHYSMGGLWVDYERTAAGGLVVGSPRNQLTNIPGPVRHRRVRLPVSRRQPAGGQFAVELHLQRADRGAGHRQLDQERPRARRPSSRPRCSKAPSPRHQAAHDHLLNRPRGGENPYLLHQELGKVMTKAATVVRHNDTLREAYAKVSELAERAERCSLSDTGNWTNQNVVFTKSLLGHVSAGQGDRQRRLAARRMPRRPLQAGLRHAGSRRRPTRPSIAAQAEAWCDRFEANTQKWLKTTIATLLGRRADADLRGSRHVADSAPTAVVWPGRRAK